MLQNALELGRETKSTLDNRSVHSDPQSRPLCRSKYACLFILKLPTVRLLLLLQELLNDIKSSLLCDLQLCTSPAAPGLLVHSRSVVL